MGTFSRLRYVMAANVNALLEKAEDPEKLLRALIREMEDASEEARAASADLLAEQTRLDRLVREFGERETQWQERAEEAVGRDRDDLARAALKARAEVAAQREALASEQKRLAERIDQMEQDMRTLKAKLADAKSRLKQMAVQPGSTKSTSARAPSSPGERRARRAMERFDRLQAQVESLEARVRSYDVGGPAPSAWNNSTDEPVDPAVESELEELKRRVAGKNAPTPDPASSEA
ncbi:MAG: PspA/IM30 family protein [Lysobacterales bacterium]